ncbi:hypothetical protein LCGC14_2349300, partial [marine sediment metagenome]
TGFIGIGGRRGQLEARQEVLRHIDEGIETVDPALKPIRTEVDNILAGVDDPVRTGIKTKADEIQDALDFGDKVKLQQLGIDPQDIDNPAVLARIREEAPEIANKIDEVAPKVVKEVGGIRSDFARRLMTKFKSAKPASVRSRLLRDETALRPILEDDAAGVADALGLDTVTDNMMDQARRQLNKATLESLNARGLPNEFVVFRGGVPDQEIVSVSLSPGTGRNFSTRFGRVQPGTQDASLFLAYRVRKQNILADTNAFSGVSGLQEEELFIRATDLTPLGEVVEAAPLPGEKIFTSVDQEVKDALDETGLRLVSPDDTPAGGGMFITRDGKMVGVRAEDIPEGGLIGGHDNFSEFILPVEKNINDQGFIRIIERPNELNIQVSHLDDLTPEALRALQVRATKYSSGTPAFIDVGVFREGIESIRTTVDDIVDGRLLNLVRRAGLTPRTVTKAAPRIAEAAPEKIATALTADGNIIGLSKKVWTSKNSGVLGDELASELHQFLLAGTQTGGRKLHKDVRFIDELYEAYTPVREALREEFGDTIRLVRYQRGVEGPG